MNELQHHQSLERDKQYVRYFKAYCRKIDEANSTTEDKEKNVEEVHQLLIQAAYLGVQMIIRKPKPTDLQHAQEQFNFISITKSMLAHYTMGELISAFPITKQYDGEKYDLKDYWTTKEAITEYLIEHGLTYNDPLGDDILELLYDYQNPLLSLFTVASMTAISKVNQFKGGIGLFEEFIASQGQAYYIQKGKPVRIKSSQVSHLKRIK